MLLPRCFAARAGSAVRSRAAPAHPHRAAARGRGACPLNLALSYNVLLAGRLCSRACTSRARQHVDVARSALPCAKPKAYPRGAGRVVPAGCRGSRDYWGFMQKGPPSGGTCICSPRCPAGMHDMGISCVKHTYDTGVGLARAAWIAHLMPCDARLMPCVVN